MRHCHSSFRFGPFLRRGFMLLAMLEVFGPGLFSAITIPALAQQRFASADEAVKTLVAATKAKDTNAIYTIFGPASRELISPDVVQAQDEYEIFVRRLTEKVYQLSESE